MDNDDHWESVPISVTQKVTSESPKSRHGSESTPPLNSAHQQHITFSLGDFEIETNRLQRASPPPASHDVLIPSFDSKDSGVPGSDLEEQVKSSTYTKRQWLVLAVYGFAQFFTGVNVSLQAPFYPAEAESKGVTASEYGVVFGVYELTVFAVSFVYGKYMVKVGPKFAFNIGLLVMGVSTIFFGFLDRVEGRTTFFALSMVTRIVEALGSAATMNAALCIIALEFPKSVATVLASMETAIGAGFACGPVIGGALFQLGGFTVPFATSGILLVAVFIFSFFVLPPPVDSNEGMDGSKGFIHLLKIPAIILSSFSMFVGSLSIGFLESTMEPHIRQFELSPVLVGVVLVITGLCYAILAPGWGRLCDIKPEWLDIYTLLGSIFSIIGFLLIGPAPFFPFDTTLWLTCVGLVFHGAAIGGCLVPSFIKCFETAREYGFPDNVATYSLLSALWAAFFSLGSFLGPTVSGILFDAVGFRSGTLFVVGLQLVVVVSLLFKFCCTKKSTNNKTPRTMSDVNENSPLLSNSKS